MPTLDVDCDGVLTTDVDDADPGLLAIAGDADCDGVLTADDCDDNDLNSTIVATDGDCDGLMTIDDCDDTDPSLNCADVDGDGYSTCDDDCDDSDGTTFPGAAFHQSSTECLTDGDGDGYSATATMVQVPETFCYTVDMSDTNGDGWSSNALDFYVDGVLYTSASLPSGSSDTVNVCVTAAEVEIVWTMGSFANEVAFTLYDDVGTILVSAVGHGSGTYLVDGNGAPIINQSVLHSEVVMASLSALDCDDSSPSTYVGATELINNLDDDCDGVVDENTLVYDDDGDGYSELFGDCDDADAFIYPGGVEIENGSDDDCDGVIDNGTNAYDDDGDGYSENQGDCDDSNSSVYPFAAEVVNNLDDDCDGVVDNTAGPSVNAVPDFSLPDTNPASPTVGQNISPSDYLQQISGWYFIKST